VFCRYDTDADCCNAEVVPDGVFFREFGAAPNQAINNHAIWVASVMISKQATAPPGRSPPLGVAQQANLLSSAFIDPDVPDRKLAGRGCDHSSGFGQFGLGNQHELWLRRSRLPIGWSVHAYLICGLVYIVA
jgi:hypothetical protein